MNGHDRECGCDICEPRRLRDYLSGPERDELANVMRNEPVHPGDTISHATARALNNKGLIRRQGVNWVACWERIKSGRPLAP